jgi:hypothetical protein
MDADRKLAEDLSKALTALGYRSTEGPWAKTESHEGSSPDQGAGEGKAPRPVRRARPRADDGAAARGDPKPPAKKARRGG